MLLSRYLKAFNSGKGEILLFSTRTFALIKVPEEVFRDIEKGSISPEEKKTLLRLGFLVQDLEKEKGEVCTLQERFTRAYGCTDAMVVLNLDCNLACPYCYEEAYKGSHYMTPETGEKMVDYLLQRETPLKVLFYGGEPLLSLALLKEKARKLKLRLEERGQSLTLNLITNGTLLNRKTALELKALGLTSAKFTLDGPKDIHDQFRCFKSGKGTFDILIKNIKEIKDVIEVTISGNYTQKNFRKFPRLLDELLENGIGPKDLGFIMFDPVFTTKKEFSLPDFSKPCLTLKEPWVMEASMYLREEIMKRGFPVPRTGPAFCMVERDDQLVIQYDGSIYKCPGLMGWKELCVGHIDTGIKDFTQSHRVGRWKRDECLDCVYLPMCFGGCRYASMLETGGMEALDCKKDMWDKTLQIILNQDIKYGYLGKRP